MIDTLPPFSIDVTPESVCRWLIGRDGRLPGSAPEPGQDVPMSYLFFLRGQPAAAMSVHELLGRDPDRGLFGGVRYERHRGVRIGDQLGATAHVTERKTADSPRGDMVLTTLVTEWRAGDDLAVTETVRMIDLPPGPPTAPADGQATDQALKFVGVPVTFTRTQIAWLTVETGDLNPLHLDRDYAASRLFPDVVVPGTLIVPVAEKALTDAAGAPLQILDIRFRAPTYPGEEIIVAAAEDGGEWRFEVTGGSKIRAIGRASVVGSES